MLTLGAKDAFVVVVPSETVPFMKSNFFKETQTLMFSCEFCGNCKIICFKEHLSQVICFRTEIWKIISKFVNLKKANKQTNIKNVYVMFYYEIHWFYQDFKSENLCFLNLYSVNIARILNLSSS